MQTERGTPAGHIPDNPFSYLIAIDTYNEIWQQQQQQRQQQQLWEAAARQRATTRSCYRPCVSSLEPVDDSGREESKFDQYRLYHMKK